MLEAGVIIFLSCYSCCSHFNHNSGNEFFQFISSLSGPVPQIRYNQKVSFIHGSILYQKILESFSAVDAAFIDPDWAVTGPDHVYKFIDSNTQPPADTILYKILEITKNVAIVLPPLINVGELVGLPTHERESLFIGSSHELYCLYFGELMNVEGTTEFRIPD